MNYRELLKQMPAKIMSRSPRLSMYRLMALFVLYKGYSVYQSGQNERIVSYKELCDDGTSNTLMVDSGLINEHFSPSYCVLSGTAQTLFAGMMKKKPIEYNKEFLKLPDGGQIALQSIFWANSKGIVCIIPGICGDASHAYVINTAQKALENDYSVYVINHRGLSDTKLLTPVTYHGGSSFDTKAAFNHISDKHKGEPLYAVAFSLGASILGKYLGDEGSNSKLSGAVWICWPYIPLEASSFSEASCFGLVSRYLAWSAKRTLNKHQYIFPDFEEVHGLDLKELMKGISKFRDFDDKITARMFGYTGVIDYYQKWSVVSRMQNIRTKTLFITSIDDPFFGPTVIPYDEFEKNESIYLLATPGGGHVGFYDSIFSTQQWHNKPAMKFFDYLNTTDRFLVSA